MMKLAILIGFLLISAVVLAQDALTSTASGNWINPFSWSGILVWPEAEDTATINAAHTINVATVNCSVYDLNLNGTLNSNAGFSLDILNNLIIAATGALNIDTGRVVVSNIFRSEGSITINGSKNAGIECKDSIIIDNKSNLYPINGSVLIQSGLQF